MTDDEKIAGLQGMLNEPEGKYTHDQVRARLGQLYQTQLRPGEMYGSPPPTPPPPPKRTPFDWVLPMAQRAAATASEYAPVVGEAANRFINTAGLGLPNAAEDAIANLTHGSVRIGDTPAQRQDFEKNHPTLANAADAAGYMAPSGELNLPFRGVRYAIPAGGIPDAIAKGVGRGVDDITGALARRYASSRAARIAEKVVGNTAASMGTAGTVRGAEGLVRGETPDQAGTNALYAATSPQSVVGGAAFGAASGVGREAAAAARAASPDIAVLARHGLEPGPIPGRPVISMDKSVLSQIPGMSEPPLGVSRATPATRGAATRQAGDAIRSDLEARQTANGRRFGELHDQLLSEEGANPARFRHVVNQIDTDLSGADLSDETRAGLMDVRKKFEPFMSTPPSHPSLTMIDEAMKGASPANLKSLQATRAQIVRSLPQTAPPQPFTAADVNEIRRYANTKIGPGKIDSGDQKFVRLQGMLADTLRDSAPRLADLNSQYSDVAKGFDQRRALLGEPENPGRGPYAEEREGRAVASRLRQGGEQSATAGHGITEEGHSNDRLAAMGAPPTLPGTLVPPEPTYGARLEVPRLQLAQEGIQLMPGHAFSAAGGYGPRGMAARAAQFAPTRVLYPLARRMGDASVGTRTLASDPLIRAIMARQPQDRSNDNAH